MFNPQSIGSLKSVTAVAVGILVLGAALWLPRMLSGAYPPHAQAAGLSLPGKAQPATPTSTPECGPAWRLVESPNVADRDNTLSALAALASNDVWAVGSTGS